MKTPFLRNGDLVPGPGGYVMASGPDKIIQDLRVALGEPLGIDRFHRGWGSQIDDLIGLPINEQTAFMLEQEVNRVIGNYMAVQETNVRREQTGGGNRTHYTTSDVLAEVQSVDVDYSQDRASVTITVRTLAGDTATTEIEVRNDG